ncbi:putative transporter svop-1 [Tigriopus californicus]|uniref:putative transporter svop-1 n=1 Tax=Tigriopus californicus TaxID=6832 RepID=UPI0027D9E892|nr:putative transporter svop-1 [Tigriopus californicus]|eukprot:TCALIF_01313-PA protein Name:"Similar to svop Synaptic vesicle 2-related protein (Xenopus laevis)" AED:0.23 eAED:0.24 QI:0/-1/0/1/-1/1/1/0/533
MRGLGLQRSTSSASSASKSPYLFKRHPQPVHLKGHGGQIVDMDDYLIGADIQLTAATSGVVPDDTFTVPEAVNALGFGKFQIVLSFVTGLCWMADSMEIMLLSILSPALLCEWGISQYNQALLTTVVFGGMMLSSLFWGKFSDKYGRRQALLLSSFFIFFYGVLSAMAPNFYWVLFLRFLVGFQIGCVPQSVTLYSEFLPTKLRAKCVVLLDCFWAVGACFEVLLAAIVMPLGGWRLLLVISALPSLLFVFCCLWLPESARLNAAQGHSEQALETIERIARDNNKPMLLGRLTVDEDMVNTIYARGSFSDLLSDELRRTTLYLWFIWSTTSFIYYGILLMTTEIFESPGDDICGLDDNWKDKCSAQCSPLDSKDYGHLLWTTLAEFPGIMITISMIERLGRRRTLAIEFLLLAGTLCFLFQCTKNHTWVTAILFIVRGIASGVFQAAYVYTPEVYPTILRSVGIGACSAMARAGAMLTPYVAQVVITASLSGAVGVYVTLAVMAAIVCFLLPLETRGQELREQSPRGSKVING